MATEDERIKCFKCGKKKMEVTTQLIEGKEYVHKYCTSCKFTNVNPIQTLEDGKK